jgi:hypothetical protein
MMHGRDLSRALRTIAWAIQTYPRDIRSYLRLGRVLMMLPGAAFRRSEHRS